VVGCWEYGNGPSGFMKENFNISRNIPKFVTEINFHSSRAYFLDSGVVVSLRHFIWDLLNSFVSEDNCEGASFLLLTLCEELGRFLHRITG
jgi:hypothetical protein